jgi:hypothetical protein
VIDHPDGVVDFQRALTRRLQRKADPLGVEVRSAGTAFALYGPDRNVYLYRQGVGGDIQWLDYEVASEALERHIAAPMKDW